MFLLFSYSFLQNTSNSTSSPPQRIQRIMKGGWCGCLKWFVELLVLYVLKNNNENIPIYKIIKKSILGDDV